jgi:DNA-directed RNA polymerase subunit RPC12/RpoP
MAQTREPWLNPAAASRCYGKAGFRRWEKAEILAERASLKTGTLIVAYQCFDCGRIHIGHADETQVRIRKEMLLQANTTCPRCGKLLDDARTSLQRFAAYPRCPFRFHTPNHNADSGSNRGLSGCDQLGE